MPQEGLKDLPIVNMKSLCCDVTDSTVKHQPQSQKHPRFCEEGGFHALKNVAKGAAETAAAKLTSAKGAVKSAVSSGMVQTAP